MCGRHIEYLLVYSHSGENKTSRVCGVKIMQVTTLRSTGKATRETVRRCRLLVFTGALLGLVAAALRHKLLCHASPLGTSAVALLVTI